MSLRLPAAPTTLVFLLLLAAHARAADFVDSTERYVALPDRIGRVMPADQSAAVLIYVLAPEKLVGWSRPLSREQRAFMPAKLARLPVVGQLTESNPTTVADAVARLRPDLIVETGVASPEAAAFADAIQQRTGIPYVGPDGLETGLARSQAMATIDQAGVINVAAPLGSGQLTRVTREQIFAWDPAIIIAQQPSFYTALQRDRAWRGVAAVAKKRIYLAPADPFGWIDDPPGVNRVIGLPWLSALFYPDVYQEDLRASVREFYDKFYLIKLSDKQLVALVRRAEAQPGETRRPIDVPLLGAEPVPLPGPSPVPQGRPPGRGSPLPSPLPGGP